MVERINSRETDVNNLLEKARELAGDDAALLEDLNERFYKLQTLASRKHEQFEKLTNRWKKMTEQRKRMMGVLRATQFVANRKPIKSSKDARGELNDIEVNACRIYVSALVFLLQNYPLDENLDLFSVLCLLYK